MLCQPGADDGAFASDHLEYPLGQAGIEGELGKTDGAQRGDLGRLDHDRVARGQGRADLPRRDGDGKVPGDDGADHAERFVEGHVDPARDRNGRSPVLVDCAGVKVEDLGDHADFVAAFGDGLAHVGRLELGQLFGVLLYLGCEPAHQAGPVGRSDRLPRRAGREGAGHRLVGLLHSADGHFGDDLLGGRIDDPGRWAHGCSFTLRRSSMGARTLRSTWRCTLRPRWGTTSCLGPTASDISGRIDQAGEQPDVAVLFGVPLNPHREGPAQHLDRLDNAVVATSRHQQ